VKGVPLSARAAVSFATCQKKKKKNRTAILTCDWDSAASASSGNTGVPEGSDSALQRPATHKSTVLAGNNHTVAGATATAHAGRVLNVFAGILLERSHDCVEGVAADGWGAASASYAVIALGRCRMCGDGQGGGQEKGGDFGDGELHCGADLGISV
jgi:hypothetical protein